MAAITSCLVRLIARWSLGLQWCNLSNHIQRDIDRSVEELDRIPPVLVIALIAGEDRRFLNHKGLDFRSIIRALLCNVRAGCIVQGASTIEQQLIRTYTNDRKQNFRRKLREALLATLLSSMFSKDKIARLYILRAYYGWRGNGIMQMCIRLEYDLESLSLEDACYIIACLKYPAPQNPSLKSRKAIRERATYISDMIENARHPKRVLIYARERD
ncbi:MAG: transglycosylase domain-containing protein [Firmicutes bacterium]|nr:transglycosylase domain-containing protein [Bacillota bacterium]